eukprot:365428-Chlamydomonas_euryale.AAC.2
MDGARGRGGRRDGVRERLDVNARQCETNSAEQTAVTRHSAPPPRSCSTWRTDARSRPAWPLAALPSRKHDRAQAPSPRTRTKCDTVY